MYCTECGNKRNPNAKFCQNCGLRFSEQQNNQQQQTNTLPMGAFLMGGLIGSDFFGGGGDFGDCGGC